MSLEQKWPDGLKKTRPRTRVLEVLTGSDRPLSAMDIALKIENSGEPACLSTVYRVLESFETHDMVVRLPGLTGDMALFELARPRHRHYAVCVDCHRIIPMEECPVEQFKPRIAEEGFDVTGHNLEIFGHCKNCRSEGGK